MSGVCGIVRFDGADVPAEDLNRQLAALAHRGPDRARGWRDGPAALGSLLMRVTGEDWLDAQPLRDPERDLTFVCDARLDNREDIAVALGLDAESLARMADSEVIFAAYKEWGADCAARLVGDFVFAVWDGAAGALTLARDHMGQRHLYLHVGSGFAAFASERKGLWVLPDIPRRLPRDRIARILVASSGRPTRHTLDLFAPEGLCALLGGTLVTIGPDGAVSERRFWSPHAAAEHLNRDEAYYVDAYRRILGEAVACRVRRARAPVALLMGGGFDSGAIAGLAGTVLGPLDRKLVAVASVMPEGGDPHPRDARKWVEVCRRHMPHLDVRYVTDVEADLHADLDRGFWARDNGSSENGWVGGAMFSIARASGARVIMDGNGGDYTVNPRGKGYFVDMLQKGRFRRFLSEWRHRRRATGRTHFQMLKSEVLLFAAPWLISRWLRWRIGLAPFGPTLPAARAFVKEAAALGVTPPRPGWKSMRQSMLAALEAQRSMHSVGWAPNAWAHDLEFTQPFHDPRVVELALAMPEELFIHKGKERHFARAALKDVYPPEFQHRPDFNDAMQPNFLAMAKRLQPTLMAEIDRMERSGKLSAYLDFPKMRRMLTRTRPGRPDEPYEYAVHQAIRAFIWGRYIEWFSGANS